VPIVLLLDDRVWGQISKGEVTEVPNRCWHIGGIVLAMMSVEKCLMLFIVATWKAGKADDHLWRCGCLHRLIRLLEQVKWMWNCWPDYLEDSVVKHELVRQTLEQVNNRCGIVDVIVEITGCSVSLALSLSCEKAYFLCILYFLNTGEDERYVRLLCKSKRMVCRLPYDNWKVNYEVLNLLSLHRCQVKQFQVQLETRALQFMLFIFQACVVMVFPCVLILNKSSLDTERKVRWSKFKFLVKPCLMLLAFVVGILWEAGTEAKGPLMTWLDKFVGSNPCMYNSVPA
jgi:hypothetical protein